MNVIAWLEYELAYYDSAVHRFNHYTTRTPPPIFGEKIQWKKKRLKAFVLFENISRSWTARLRQALYVGLHFECEATWEDGSRYNVTLVSDHLKYYDCNAFLVFINIGTSSGNRVSRRLFCEFPIWCWFKFFPFEKKPKHVILEEVFLSLVLHSPW